MWNREWARVYNFVPTKRVAVGWMGTFGQYDTGLFGFSNLFEFVTEKK